MKTYNNKRSAAGVFCAAYVEFVHDVEALHTTATRPATAHEHSEDAAQAPKDAQEHNH